MMRVCAFLSIVALLPSLAGAEEPRKPRVKTPKDIVAYYPEAMRAFQIAAQKIPLFTAMPWLYNLEGPADEVVTVLLEGKFYFLGKICNPAACDKNYMVYMIQRDGVDLWALVELLPGMMHVPGGGIVGSMGFTNDGFDNLPKSTRELMLEFLRVKKVSHIVR